MHNGRPQVYGMASGNQHNNTRICALATTTPAQPNGPDHLDDFDFNFTDIAAMGGQFSDMLAHSQFGHMKMPPTMTSMRSESSRCPPSHVQPESPPVQPLPMHGDASAYGMGTSTFAMELNHIGTCTEVAHGRCNVSTDSATDSKRSGVQQSHPLNDIVCPPNQHCWGWTDDCGGQLRRQPDYLQTSPYSLPCNLAQAAPGPPTGFESLKSTHDSTSPAMDSQQSMQELFPELDLPAHFMGQDSLFTHAMSRSSDPSNANFHTLTAEEDNNFSYQPGVGNGTIEHMLGWAHRAPNIGDGFMPRLQVDTNLLAPPNLSPVHRSSSSASSAGSSARSPRRRRGEMQFGDFLCGHCEAAFHTQGDLTHHLRSHQPYQSRNHVCEHCQKRFQYRKDLARHLPRHDPNRQKYYCKHPNCKYFTRGFGRQDHLDRHLQSQHKEDPASAVSTSSPSRVREW